MYGVNDGLKVDFMPGTYLASIDIGVAQVAFHFAKVNGLGSSIFVRGQFSISRQSAGAERATADCAHGVKDFQNQPSALQALSSALLLLSHDVVSAELLNEENAVLIQFATGALFIWESNSPAYESFEIRHGEEIYVV